MTTSDLTVEARLRDEISGPLRKVKREVHGVGEEVHKTNRSAGGLRGGFESLAKSGSKTAAFLGNTLKRAAHIGAMALLAAAAATVVLARKFVSLASSAKETETKFAKVFGNNTRTVKAWVTATSNAYGRTQKSLEDATAKFGVFGKAAGISADKLPTFSTRLAQAGLDLASFYNKDSSEVFDALSSGLAGMTRPLRQFGIFLSKAKMEAQATAMGLDPKKLSDGQAVMVRQALIIKQLGDANGDLARTHDSLANRTRAFKGRLEELETQIGVGLMPVAGALIGFLEKRMAPVMARLTHDAPKFAGAWKDVFQRNDWTKFGKLLDHVLGGNGRHAKGIAKTGAALGRFVRGVPHDLSVVAHVLGVIFGTIGRWGGYLLRIWKDGVAPAFSDLGSSAGGAQPALDAVSHVLKWIADHAKTLEPLISTLVTTWVAYKVASLAAAAAQWAMNLATEANPYVALATAVVVLVILLAKLYKRTNGFGHLMEKVGKVVKWIAHNWREFAGLIAAGFLLGPIGLLIGALVMVWRHVKPVRDVVHAIGRISLDGLKGALHWIAQKLHAIASAARSAAHWITHLPGAGIIKAGIKGITHLPGLGDTSRPMSGGRGARRAAANLGHTLAVHRAADAAAPGRRLITSSIRNHSLGSANSDHPAGKALDVVGSGLGAYRQEIRARGGYAEYHGSGAGRHLHAAIGDTSRPMSGSSSSSSDGAVIIQIAAGAILVQNPTSNIELDKAIAAGVARYVRDRHERRLP